MITVRFRLLYGAIAMSLMATTALAQQDQPAKPLGDVAREQQQARKAEKKASSARVFTDIEGDKLQSEPRSDSAKPDSSLAAPVKAAPVEQDVQPKVAAKPIPTPRRSVFDQVKSKKP